MQSTRASVFALLTALALVALSPATMQADHLSSSDETQPVWFEWSRHEFNLLIVPPEHGQLVNGNGILGGGSGGIEEATILNSYVDAIEDSVQAWRDAIAQFAEPWLADNFSLTHYVLGRDTIPVGTVFNIIFYTDTTKGPVLGVAVSSHPCIANSSKWLIQSFTANDMFNVAGHEIGHCLGLDHSTFHHDIMHATYEYFIGTGSNPRLCPSNLNVDGLHGVFAADLNQAGRAGQDGEVGATKDMGPYDRVSC